MDRWELALALMDVAGEVAVVAPGAAPRIYEELVGQGLERGVYVWDGTTASIVTLAEFRRDVEAFGVSDAPPGPLRSLKWQVRNPAKIL